jgi:AraC-like DNA-binding protein
MKNKGVENNAISSKNVIFADDDYILYRFPSQSSSRVIEYSPKNNFLELFLCKKGEVSLSNEVINSAISEKRSLLFYDSQMRKVSIDIEKNTTLFLLQLSLKNLHLLLSNNQMNLFGENLFSTQKPIIELKENNLEIIQTINSIDIDQRKQSVKTLFLRGKILEIISYFGEDSMSVEEGKCPFTSSKKNTIILARNILIEDLKSAPKIEEIANMLSISQKKLKQEFKEMYGFPIYTYYLNYKLEIARELLEQKGKSILEISQIIGYSTDSHFVAAFKKKYKITPKKYQNK